MFPEGGEIEGVFSMENGGRIADESEPFYVLLMGDWAGGNVSRPIEVDRDNFEAVLNRFHPSVELGFNGTADRLRISFEELDDFHPDNIFQRLNIFSELRDIRSRLRSPETFDRAANEVRSWFDTESSENSESSAAFSDGSSENIAAADLLGSILDSASVPKARSEETELGRFVSKIVAPYIVRVDEDEQSRLTAWLDAAIGDLMRQILHHPDFQTMEAAWRGLYFLVRRMETDRDLRVFILDCPKSQLSDKLRAVNKLEESDIFRSVVEDGVDGRPFSVIGGNYEFFADVDDVALLIRMSAIAEAAGAPFLSYIRPTMFTGMSLSDAFDEGKLVFAEETREAKLWNVMRENEGSSFLGLCGQKVLGRLPYGGKTDEVETFAFEEFAEGNPHTDYLWVNPCFALTLLVAGSYRSYGADVWGRLANEITKLPVHTFTSQGEIKTKSVAEFVFTESAAEVVVENGLIALAAFRDSDRFRVVRWQSISSPFSRLGS